jgi:hypothetical protein
MLWENSALEKSSWVDEICCEAMDVEYGLVVWVEILHILSQWPFSAKSPP